MVIYKTTNLINGKIYVGLNTTDDPTYLGSGTALKKAVSFYGKKNFKKEILEECETMQELYDREYYWIRKLDSTNRKIGYNISEGGETAYKNNIIYYEKHKNIGKKHTEETIRRMSKPRSKEGCRNISNALKGNIPWNKGKKLGPLSDEQKKKLSKEVHQFDLDGNYIATFESIKKAQEVTGAGSISAACKNKLYYKSSGGYQWSYDINFNKKFISHETSYKKVHQFDLDGNYIATFETVTEAMNVTNSPSICAVCKNRRKSSGGFKWSYTLE